MKATLTEIEEIFSLMQEIPASIATMANASPVERLNESEAENSWSANDILGHLRACADVWGDTIERMLAEERPTLPDIHPRKWIKQTNYLDLEFHKSFRAYASQRKHLLKILMKLSFEDWSRSAMIGGRLHTVFTQARRIAKHEAEHRRQIEKLLAK